MDNKKYAIKLLKESNFSTLNASDFVNEYVEKLVYNIVTYVDSNIQVGKIHNPEFYCGTNGFSQEITGNLKANSYIDGTEDTLLFFATKYSRLRIDSFNILAKESICDFLDLQNSLFVVDLSIKGIKELSLKVPKQNGKYEINNTMYHSIIVIPIIFKCGTLNFLLCEKPL